MTVFLLQSPQYISSCFKNKIWSKVNQLAMCFLHTRLAFNVMMFSTKRWDQIPKTRSLCRSHVEVWHPHPVTTVTYVPQTWLVTYINTAASAVKSFSLLRELLYQFCLLRPIISTNYERRTCNFLFGCLYLPLQWAAAEKLQEEGSLSLWKAY